jgi:hypothetical protein
MVKIHFIGGENLVVDVADPASLAAALRDPDGVLEVTHDGRPLVLAVRAIAAIALLS